MTDARGRRVWPWLVTAGASGVLAVGLVGSWWPVLGGAGPHPGQAVVVTLMLASCLGSGAVLVARRPDHPVGWLLWLPALYLGLEATAEVVERTVGAGPQLTWARWAAAASWPCSFVPLGTHLPLLFPTGAPPTRRWRWVLWTGAASLALLTVANAVNPDLLPSDANPVGLEGALPEVISLVGGVLMVVSFVAAVASALVRFRRSTGVERQQLRWFARIAALVPPVWVVAIAFERGPNADVSGLVLAAVLGLLPVTVAVAVLRYRLYDIDRIVSRTVGWALLTALLGAVYASLVVTAQALVGRDVPDVVIALATLSTAALFQPLRRRVQDAVDRRFNRARYDAAATVAAFGQRLRDEFEPDHVAAELTAATRRAVGPSSLGLWTASGR